MGVNDDCCELIFLRPASRFSGAEREFLVLAGRAVGGGGDK